MNFVLLHDIIIIIIMFSCYIAHYHDEAMLNALYVITPVIGSVSGQYHLHSMLIHIHMAFTSNQVPIYTPDRHMMALRYPYSCIPRCLSNQ